MMKELMEIECPHCHKTFMPRKVDNVEIEREDDGSVTVRARLVAGLGDSGLWDTFRLPSVEYYDEEEENEEGHKRLTTKVRDLHWTDEEIYGVIEQRLNERQEAYRRSQTR